MVDKCTLVEVTAGVPQGLVLGPTLWNLAYNGVMNCQYGEDITPFAFVDNLAMLIVALALHEPNLGFRVRHTGNIVKNWMTDNALKLAAEKTEVIILKDTCIAVLPPLDINDIKLQLLINHISPRVYTYISDCNTYNESIQTLDKIYIKPNNTIHARHILTTRRQQADESIDSYMQSLKQLAKDCNFTAVDADTNKNDTIRGAFIAGMTSTKIRSRLLESLTLTLEETYNIAISMEMAELNSQVYSNQHSTLSALPGNYQFESQSSPKNSECVTVTAATNSTNFSRSGHKCFFCGGPIHSRKNCPARESICKSPRKPCIQTVSMASLSHTSEVKGVTTQNIKIGDHSYDNINLLIVKNLCADIIIGHDVLSNHSSLEFEFGGPKEVFKVCSVVEASVPAVPLFCNLTSNCKPIAVKSRRHSAEDQIFIKNEIKKFLNDGIIEESQSPWRAQVLITKNETHKKRLVIDYSQTINRFTQLDAYPLPNIEEMVSNVSQFTVFSAIDFQSAYHQVPILPHEKMYTAFEAAGKLYQFCRIPFVVTNGVASFQRTIDWLIRTENLEGTYAYLDDITVCGPNHVIKPDASRLQPLLKMPPPNDTASLRGVLGMFAHYSKWIPKFSERVHTLAHVNNFPLNEDALSCFENLKSIVAKSSVHAINENMPFVVETDASEHSIAATLSQDSRPVAFFSRSLNSSELNHSAVEKEAYAIVESLKKWRHFLIGKPFTIITDQKSVTFMFNTKHSSKIKNEKIQRWRLELAPYKYDIVYRPGKDNQAADALSRICSCATTTAAGASKLKSLHTALCHPGVTHEYSRFPFAFPCSDISAKTVIKNLNNLFMMFGMPAYIHSDTGAQFLSAEIKEFLNARGIAKSRTTAYNPQGNGQVEKLNSTV
ncbi:uncharacterized protein [Diabrotica undecimpunctata]|uniref:uncharacterized protein n=1 Tax=Diabrotica undecimpunctata TaxID=50387 RepID=UPI003B63BE98